FHGLKTGQKLCHFVGAVSVFRLLKPAEGPVPKDRSRLREKVAESSDRFRPDIVSLDQVDRQKDGQVFLLGIAKDGRRRIDIRGRGLFGVGGNFFTLSSLKRESHRSTHNKAI